MSHAIDNSAGRDAIAYRGETPWHGLGQELTYDAPIEVWKKEAGLNFQVKRARVAYHPLEGGNPIMLKSRDVLFRDDTDAPLGIVGTGYKIVQPGEVLEFFRNLVEEGGMQLETAGALHGGKRVWALAKMNEGFDVIGHDRVMPYVLLATSFDGGLATTAKFTAVRVVCHNTITIALNSEESAAERTVKVAHNSTFDAKLIQRRMGLLQSSWSKFMKEAKTMAKAGIDSAQLDAITRTLVEPTLGPKADGTRQDIDGVRSSKAYGRILELFHGQAIGSALLQKNKETVWQWLNSVTQYVDHERGRAQDSRLNSAWFGTGDATKSRALQIAQDLVSVG